MVGEFKKDSKQGGEVNGEIYIRSKAGGQRMTTKAMGNWRREQQRKNRRESKLLKLIRKTREKIHSLENTKMSRKDWVREERRGK